MITGNDSGNYQVWNASSNTVSAYYNYWFYTNGTVIDSHIRDNEEGGGEVLFDPFLTVDESLPVVFSSIVAVPSHGYITLRWQTESESDLLGFHILRSADRDGPYVRINSSMIPGTGDSIPTREYNFVDANVEAGGVYFYYIESIDISGMRDRSGIAEAIIPPRDQAIRFEIPHVTLLLQNYPNPFNPETWIPYQLSEDSEIMFRIYNMSGELIREVDLGLVSKGYYLTRDRALRWDGRSEKGERVTSGVYICQMVTRGESLTSRIVIVK
jgi:hypothetical protein